MPKDKNPKVKISIGDAVVEVDGEVSEVTKIIEVLKGVLQGQTISTPTPISGDNHKNAADFSSGPKDIRSFLKEKDPKNLLEAAAVIAFHLQYVETEAVNRREAIDTNILMDELRKGNYKLPKAPNQVLIDAKKAGYFDSAGPGQYKLNSVGYNLVKFALGLEQKEEKKSRRRRTKKTKG
ncbi:MAG: hypothetical protein PHX98_03620 [Candidatus Moranbacteria bacterium]|nr:hypothetical protein [Candidatus Moranbacteria bacterium]